MKTTKDSSGRYFLLNPLERLGEHSAAFGRNHVKKKIAEKKKYPQITQMNTD